MITFTTREEYLEAIADWKIDYLELSKNIRLARLAYKEAQRQGVSVYKTLGEYTDLKDRATSMITDRHDSKIEAQRQYLLARSEKLAA